ncbi:MAG: N-acetylmuramoyl-L-alanine amidase [Candidatus Omnitrophica bacterium]|nr:N-acetylmuramoyl-L-alanine amidase [Candidatus Omnitrophota bacterium]
MNKKIITTIISLILLCVCLPAFAYRIKGLEKDIDTPNVKIEGKSYVLLVDICDANGINWDWDSISRRITLEKNGLETVLLLGSRYYYTQDVIKKLSAPVILKKGSVYVPLKFARGKVRDLFALGKKYKIAHTKSKTAKEKQDIQPKKSARKKYEIKKVVIDPGHGGKDPGAVSRSGLYEKTVVLDVAKKIKKLLEQEGIDVTMTRDSDIFIPLGKRARIANENDADLFVSIHANANNNRWIKGFEIYCLTDKATDDNARALAASENSALEYEEGSFANSSKMTEAIVWDLKFSENREESIELAESIYEDVSEKMNLKKKNVRSARFYVLKGTEMPSVLVELSYLSNKTDENNLKKSSYKQKLAEGIVSGILNYKGKYEGSNGFSQ